MRRIGCILLVLALLATAVQPTLIIGGAPHAYAWGLHQSLFAVALLLLALDHRATITWTSPIVVFPLVFILASVFGALEPRLTFAASVGYLALLVLPFTFSEVARTDDEQRERIALVIALLPLLSVVIGLAIQAVGGRPAFLGLRDRLEGATGNAGTFALLAFAGFAVALHGVAKGRVWSGRLATLDLACILLSGSRMAMLSTTLFVGAFVLTSKVLRRRLREARLWLFAALTGLGVILAAYLPTLYRRTMMRYRDGSYDVFRRADTWRYYLDDWLMSPLFGRGFGSGLVTGPGRSEDFPTAPHNEYLHLVLTGGAFGGALMLLSIGLWYRRIVRDASIDDRPFILSLGAGLALYALADNVLLYFSALPVFAYLGVLRWQDRAHGRPDRTAPQPPV